MPLEQGGLPLKQGGSALWRVCIWGGGGGGGRSPSTRGILPDMVNEWAVHILLECILVDVW